VGDRQSPRVDEATSRRTEAETRAPAHSPPWLFGLPYLGYGIPAGFAGIAMPYLARTRAGVEMDSIGWFTFLTLFPPIVQFMYAPIVDVGMRRRNWLVVVTAIGAACLFGACLMPLPSRLGWFLALIVASQAISGLIGSCIGGMCAATLPDSKRGQAGGWINAGNLAGAAIGGGVAVFMTQGNASPAALGATVAALMVVPSLAALAMIDGPRLEEPLRQRFAALMRDVGAVVRSRAGWTGILFCVSPVGTAALVNLFGGMAKDFAISDDDHTVAIINGPVGALLTAFGSLAGGFLCDRVNRRAAYLSAGALTALCAFAMTAFPLDRTTYAVGVSAYLLTSGFCYAAFSAVALEAIGTAGEAASTQYTLLSSAGNFAIAYVGKLDTVFSDRFGPKAPLATDGIANVVGIVFLAAMIALTRRRTAR